MGTPISGMGRARRRAAVLGSAIGALALATGGITSAHAAPLIGTTTLWVATTGSDTNPCTKTAPCATMQFAVDNAPAGSIIKVEAGTYNQSVNITEPLTLAGAGVGKTIIDGSNIDTEAMSPAYFGVISVENNTGASGHINIHGMTVENAFITQAEYDEDASPTDVIVYNEADAHDTVTISQMSLLAVQDPADFAGVGFDTFNSAANVSFTHSSVAGTFQGALLEGGGIGGQVTVGNDNFNHLIACSVTACGSVFPAEGLFVLSDQPGTAVDSVNTNKFQSYAGLGIAAAAGYSGGNCSGSNGPCTGNVTLTANTNTFALGACSSASDGCAAISMDAESGNELSAQIKGNKGTVQHPDGLIVEQADSGVYNVTEINNHIHFA